MSSMSLRSMLAMSTYSEHLPDSHSSARIILFPFNVLKNSTACSAVCMPSSTDAILRCKQFSNAGKPLRFAGNLISNKVATRMTFAAGRMSHQLVLQFRQSPMHHLKRDSTRSHLIRRMIHLYPSVLKYAQVARH